MGTNVWPGNEPLYVARDRELYGSTHVHLVEYLSSTQVLEAYVNGAIDVATLTLDEVIRLAALGERPRIVAVTDISAGADSVVAGWDVRTVDGLRGRRIGVETGAFGRYLLSRALEAGGLTEADVRIVPIEVNEGERAWSSGAVDAVVTFEPFRSRLLAAGAHEVFSTRDIPGEIADVIVVRESFLRERGDDVRALVDGFTAAVELFERQPLEAARLAAPREHLAPEAFLAALEGLELAGGETNVRLLGGPRPPLRAALERVERFLARDRIIPSRIDTAALIESPVGRRP